MLHVNYISTAPEKGNGGNISENAIRHHIPCQCAPVPSSPIHFAFTVYLFGLASKRALCVITGQLVTSGPSVHFILRLSLSCILWLLLLKTQSGFC